MGLDEKVIDGLTEKFSELNITRAGDDSPKSVAEAEIHGSEHPEKRSRSDHHDFREGYPIGRSSFFDPLMYMRYNDYGTNVPGAVEPTDTQTQTLPTLDEIIAEGRRRMGKVVDTSHMRAEMSRYKQKTVRSTSSSTVPQSASRPTPKLPVAVFRFCQDNNVKFVPLAISKSFRSIAFRKSPDPAFSPWTEYITVNHLAHYRVCHAVMFRTAECCTGAEGRLVVIVPHLPKDQGEIDTKYIEECMGDSMAITRMSLTAIEKEFGFPTFVCPPFGHEYAPKIHMLPVESRKPVLTVIDSRLTMPATMECVFDLGAVAIVVRPAELKKIGQKLNWISLENVVRIK
jgi:hypothetical protein